VNVIAVKAGHENDEKIKILVEALISKLFPVYSEHLDKPSAFSGCKNSININVKNPKILSTHPTSSYKLVERGKIVEKLEITDPAAFWERSKFLVIVAD
jgi:hypothetical protein